MQRPYFKFKAKQLDAVVERKDVSQREVMEVLAELKLRQESTLNITTKEKCNTWLNKIKNETTHKSKSSQQLNVTSERNSNLELGKEALKIDNPSHAEMTLFDTASHLTFFNTPWWGFLVGGSKVIVSFSNCETVLSYKNQNIQLHNSISEHFSFQIKKAALGHHLTIKSNEGKLSCRLLGLQKKQVEQYLQSLPYAPEADSLTLQYHQMLKSDTYLNNLFFKFWLEECNLLISKFPLIASFQNIWVYKLKKNLESHQEQRRQLNREYIQRKKIEYFNFFRKVEKSPLTEKQIEAILTDEDAVLVNAGAGTGKTSTVVGKIGFLLESGTVQPSEILALAYGKDAASELRERVKTQLGVEVEVRTFHSLGKELIQQSLGHRIEISDEASDDRAFLALVAHLLQALWREPQGRKAIQEFVTTHRYPAKFLEDFDTKTDYLKYLRKIEPRTLRGEPVKSFEELLIADWLLTNGIAYEYEKPYEIDISSRKRRQYRPDFYLSDYGIYLEHFGIGKNGETAPHIDAKAYAEQIDWKRELHKKHGTTLLETYSWQRQRGILFSSLQEQLIQHGVVLDPTGGDQVQKLIQTGEINKKLVALLKDFLVAFKENQHQISEILEKLGQLTQSEQLRTKAFLNIFDSIYSKYQAHLTMRKQFDFADCISESTKALKYKKISTSFKRVIVDEYQDISNGRFNFLREIINQQIDCRLMAVGDDWQSIYGFTGSDVEKSTKFEIFFQDAKVVPLDQTFRFTKPIIAISSDFVQRNPEQLRKYVQGRDSTVKRAVHVMCAKDQSSVDIEALLKDIDDEVPKGKKWSVFLLGRYNFLCPKPHELKRLNLTFPRLEIEFCSIHASKGREADAVVLLELVGGRYGFPGSIETDPLMNLVVSGEDAYPDAEERRVLYVALTRARSKVVVSARTDIPSSFLSELLRHEQVVSNAPSVGTYACSECSGSLQLRFPNRFKGYAWQCEHQPYCEVETLMCEVCLSAPKFSHSGCQDKSCQSNQKSAQKKVSKSQLFN